jgi:hypothetical protein
LKEEKLTGKDYQRRITSMLLKMVTMDFIHQWYKKTRKIQTWQLAMIEQIAFWK